MLKLENINVTFEAGTVNENHVLKDIDLEVKEGQFVTIIGGNGAGKSTLLNTIAGAFEPDTGSVTIGGVNVTKKPAHARAKFIGRVFQDPRLGTATRMTIEENLAIAMKRGMKRGLRFGSNKDLREEFVEAIKQLDLGLEDRMTTDMGLLSGGQRQALTLLMATLTSPDLLLLDEHTAALDPKTAEQVLMLTDKIVKEKQLTTFMITHNMEDAIKFGNRLIMLHHGNIVVDLEGEAKQNVSVAELVALFKTASQTELKDDALLLG